jgi:histone deacetylase complex regulatory component SIN3
VRNRFKGEPAVYTSFKGVLTSYRRQKRGQLGKKTKTPGQVYAELEEIIRDHPDLVAELQRYYWMPIDRSADLMSADCGEEGEETAESGTDETQAGQEELDEDDYLLGLVG